MTDPVIGATITEVRPMTAAELAAEGWDLTIHGAPAALVLSTGAVIYASRDEEGNGYGALFGVLPDGGTAIAFHPAQEAT
jgi:hypothetical protein